MATRSKSIRARASTWSGPKFSTRRRDDRWGDVTIDDSPDFRPAADWQVLQLRADLLRRTRAFFESRGFLEVETPLLSADVVVDRHLDPIAVTLPDDPRQPHVGRRVWLQTSPEFGMKRLMAAGGDAIYQITRAFRAGEVGRLHNPEFTMLEWYRRGDSMNSAMQLLSELAETLLERGPADQMTYREAFETFVGIDPHAAPTTELQKVAADRAISVPETIAADDRDLLLDLLLTQLVEPNLGRQRPVILYDYPASQAALARLRDADPPVAERFELYVQGIELANGYHELLDAAELRQRNSAANQQRAAGGKPQLPTESRLLAAMEAGLPDCCGVALGFDRLVMVAAGASSLADVMSFPIDRA